MCPPHRSRHRLGAPSGAQLLHVAPQDRRQSLGWGSSVAARRIIAECRTAAGATLTGTPSRRGRLPHRRLKTDRPVSGVGKQLQGELGDGTTTGSQSPLGIGNDPTGPPSRLLPGGTVSHTTRPSHQVDGSLWAWGYNCYGQLVTAQRRTAMCPPHRGGHRLARRLVGLHHTSPSRPTAACGAWGYNIAGQLVTGDDDGTATSHPHRSGNDWSSSQRRSPHRRLKSTAASGRGATTTSGQLGDGTWVERHDPTRIGDETGWRAVSAARTHTLGLVRRTLWAWGGGIYRSARCRGGWIFVSPLLS